MNFEDFVLQFDASSRGGYRARVLKSPFGEGAVGFSLPTFAGAEPAPRVVAGISREIVQGRAAWAFGPRSPLELGTELYRSVFQGQVRTLLDKSRGQLEVSPDRGLRLKIKLDPSDEEAGALADLPWELLCDGETRDFLVLSRQISLVRYLDVPRPPHPCPFTPPLRILAVGASPRSLEPLDLAEEARSLKRLKQGSSGVQVCFLAHASAEAVRKALSEDSYNVLHFMGHGTFDEVSGEGMLAFEGPDGSPELVSGRAFAAKLTDLSPLGVVVLNACNTARTRYQHGANPFRGVATALVHGGVPAVVAMQRPISDDAAIGFSSSFYRRLARGGSIDEALTEGRHAIHSAKPEEFEWAAPILFLRIPEGNVFSTKPEDRPPYVPRRASPSAARFGTTLKILAGAVAIVLMMLALYTKIASSWSDLAHSISSSLSEIRAALMSSREAKGESSAQLGGDTYHLNFRNIQNYLAVSIRGSGPPESTPRKGAIQYGSLLPPPLAAHSGSPADRASSVRSGRPVPPADTAKGRGLGGSSSRAPLIRQDSTVQPLDDFAAEDSTLSVKQVQIPACNEKYLWIAYLPDSQGKLAPVLDIPRVTDDENWLGLRFTAHEGLLTNLGILMVIDKSAEPEEQRRSDWVGRILAAALRKTNRFAVQDIQVQQGPDAKGLDSSSLNKVSSRFGVQHLVYATIEEWSSVLGSSGQGKTVEVAIRFTLADGSTGETHFSTVERARVDEQVGLEFTDVVQICANKAALKIATLLLSRVRKGTVVGIEEDSIHISAGRDQGMVPHSELLVQSVRGVAKNLESGTLLGEDLRSIGTLEVVTVHSGSSVARIVEGCKGIKVGDRIESVSSPSLPECVPSRDVQVRR